MVLHPSEAMHLSVIISTYNQPVWLEKVIWGYAAQSHRDFELVIADDGSTAETRETIDRLRNETGLTIRHVWHEDQGFRKCAILNRAILEAQAEYLIFTDGDCIPRRDFLAQHVRFAEPGYMLSGGAVRLPMDVSRKISKDDILAGRAHQASWLRSQGMPWNSKLLKLSAGPRWAWLCERLTTTKATWNGGNASTWKEAILRVNGFDERMEYGGEDRELGERLMNVGLRTKSLRFHAICVHLDHARGYVRQEALERNQAIRRETHRTHAMWSAYGISKQTEPDVVRAA
jgi:glycosyltransferase involved in cell wall biosynthesis